MEQGLRSEDWLDGNGVGYFHPDVTTSEELSVSNSSRFSTDGNEVGYFHPDVTTSEEANVLPSLNLEDCGVDVPDVGYIHPDVNITVDDSHGSTPPDVGYFHPDVSTFSAGDLQVPTRDSDGADLQQEKLIRCRNCMYQARSRSKMMKHIRMSHSDLWKRNKYQWGGSDNPPWILESGQVDHKLENIYTKFGRDIEKPHSFGKISSHYNFPLSSGEVSDSDIDEHLDRIYQDQDKTFKVNLSLGSVLENIETKEYRYWWAHFNDPVLPEPFLVSRKEDLSRLKIILHDIDFKEQVWRQRPTTKYRLLRVTNIRWYVVRTEFVLGNPKHLPTFVLNSKSLISFNSFEDNLCAFRCLIYHRLGKRKGVEMKVRSYFYKWKEYIKLRTDLERFEGLDIHKIPEFENCFKICIDLYSLTELGAVKVVYKSTGMFNDRMSLNIYQNHLCYITKFNSFAKKYQCRNCSFTSRKQFITKRHERKCCKVTRLKYKGGVFNLRKSLFDDLESYGFHVSDENKYFPYFIVYDFEVYFESELEPNAANTQWFSKHIPVSVAINSNVPGYDNAVCFINSNPTKLIHEMVGYLEKIREKTFSLMKNNFHKEIEFLENEIEKFKEFYQQSKSVDNDDDDQWKVIGDDDAGEHYDEDETRCYEAVESSMHEEPSSEFLAALAKPNTFQMFLSNLCGSGTDESVNKTIQGDYSDIEEQKVIDESEYLPHNIEAGKVDFKHKKKVLKNLLNFCSELPVLGFNSARYDINLVKGQLIKELKNLNKSKNETSFVVKRNNSYICISLNSFKFLDISQYLAPGFSYSAFLKAYDCDERKGFFPYEWFNDIGKLYYTSLPQHDDFYSSFKGCNISESEYEYCKEVWSSLKMETFKDFLVWYNKLDVIPFVQAVEKMLIFYKTYGVDLFKETISVPGVARKLIFRSIENKTFFSLPTKRFADIHKLFRKNIVGGPSLVFHRYHEVNKTRIRNGKKICKKILGLDANSLYLYAFSLPAPSGLMTVRRKENDFKPEKAEKFMKAFKWLGYISEKQDVFIQHKLNGGEKQIGPYRVDGFNHSTQTVYSFHGCYFHGHEITGQCSFKISLKNYNLKQREEIYTRTKRRKEFFISKGFKVEEIWECQFDEMVKRDSNIQYFIKSNFCRKMDRIGEMNFEKILSFVESGKLFGALEIDMEVPDHLHNKFEEMSPFFCNTIVEYDSIGKHMQDYLSLTNGSKKERKLLVGVMKVRQILIATPLLKFYIEHGIKVTNIYKVIEFTPSNCFQPFVDMVSEARRKGDADSKYEMIGQTLKLVGNSAYGSMLMDSTKHRQICYTNELVSVGKLVNNERFRQLNELGDDVYEIEMAKKVITLDLPIQIGFFILQYAKLRMLEFYFDCLDFYIRREDFQLICMDTDSYYMALSMNSLDECVKARIKEIYAKNKAKWFPRDSPNSLALFDKRTPGLFKVEFEGDRIVALCSKTYCIEKISHSGYTTKFSAKGLMKRMISNPYEKYLNVLQTSEKSGALNKGFRVHQGSMFTYSQYREGISYFYCKRLVHEDGVTTSPLNIIGCVHHSSENEKLESNIDETVY